MSITIRKPDDMHIHLRQGSMLANVLPFTSSVFARAVVMGNLSVPITTATNVVWYEKEISSQAPDFEPIMSIMLTNSTTPEIVRKANQAGAKVLKLIPGNTSTNSAEGVSLENLKEFYPVLKTVRDLDMIFSGHWELAINPYTGFEIPELRREVQAFHYLRELIRNVPGLKIVVEHMSTRAMIRLVEQAPENVAATITVHHPILSIEDVLGDNGKISNPYHYCKPIVKARINRQAIKNAVLSGNPKFFFGSDSAPHPKSAKERDSPAAGIFTAPVALPLLCKLFESRHALDKLEGFVSEFGARFYGLPLNEGTITIKQNKWTVPDQHEGIKIFQGGKQLRWRVV